MPLLQNEAKDIYIQAYGQKSYDSFTDKDGTFHGGCSVGEQEPKEEFMHRPRHDIESVFWTLLSSLLRVIPAGEKATTERNTSEGFSTAINDLDGHIIASRRSDTRQGIIDWTTKNFRSALHPDLARLAPMLAEMSAQIGPEYSYLALPQRDHLHEAMRRLLLQQIVDLELAGDEIPLDPSSVRVRTVEGKAVTDPRTNKRHFETVDIFPPKNAGNKKKKRKGMYLPRAI
jgi:hypothetical protein